MKLLMLKQRLAIANAKDDEVLLALLDDAENFILGYTRRNKTQWLKMFDGLQIKIASIEYNKLGTDGITSRKEGEISTNFMGIDDYPNSVMLALNLYRMVMIV